MRRNLFFVWAIAVLLLTVVSCKNDDKATLKAEYTGTSVSATGGTATFTIESNVDWTIANTDAWITSIEPKTGNGNNTITVTFAANTTTQERSSVFTITSEAPTKSVTIMQAAADAPAGSLTVEYIPADIPAAGGTATFKVTSNVAWTATCPESWVTLNPAQGTGNADVTVTVTANTGSVNRSATITISGVGVNNANVVISQLNDMPMLNDYLGNYTFVTDIRKITGTSDTTTPGVSYNDTLVDPGSSFECDLRFSNAVNQLNASGSFSNYKGNFFIDFDYKATSGEITLNTKYVYDYWGTKVHYGMFLPGVIVGENVYFVTAMELIFNKATGQLVFPTEFDHATQGKHQAYYTNWLLDYTTQDIVSRCNDYMTNVVATKASGSGTPGVSNSPATTGDNIVKIPVKITLPKGVDPNVPIRADQIAFFK